MKSVTALGEPNPISAYGRSKLAAEEGIQLVGVAGGALARRRSTRQFVGAAVVFEDLEIHADFLRHGFCLTGDPGRCHHIRWMVAEIPNIDRCFGGRDTATNPFRQLAQVILSSNEFVFVD